MDSAITLISYFMSIRSDSKQIDLSLKLEGSTPHGSPKSTVRKCWAQKYAETPV